METDTGTETGTDRDKDTDTGTETDTDRDKDTDTGTETDTDREKDTDTDTDTDMLLPPRTGTKKFKLKKLYPYLKKAESRFVGQNFS
jgi:hypothetical protein